MTDEDEVHARFISAINKYWWKLAWQSVRSERWGELDAEDEFLPKDFKRKLGPALKCKADRDSTSSTERENAWPRPTRTVSK
jgi:hypothetical protein